MEGISITRNFFHFPNSIRIVFFFPTWNCDILLTGTDERWAGDKEMPQERMEPEVHTQGRGMVHLKLSRCHRAWCSECFCFVFKEYLNYKAYLWLHDCVQYRDLTSLDENWSLDPTSGGLFCNTVFTSPV